MSCSRDSSIGVALHCNLQEGTRKSSSSLDLGRFFLPVYGGRGGGQSVHPTPSPALLLLEAIPYSLIGLPQLGS